MVELDQFYLKQQLNVYYEHVLHNHKELGRNEEPLIIKEKIFK